VIDLDDLDRAMLRALALDGALSAGEVGRRLGLSQPAAWRRQKRLEEAGVIKGLRLEVDRTALGFGVTVFLGVKLAAKGDCTPLITCDTYKSLSIKICNRFTNGAIVWRQTGFQTKHSIQSTAQVLSTAETQIRNAHGIGAELLQ
jgi:hypothetical protein